MLNCVALVGRLVADPELRTTSSGLSVARFRIAIDRSFTRAGEEKKTDFINIVAWRQQADFVSRYFHKGSLISIQGELHMDTYDDRQTGQKRTSYEVVANSVRFCGSKADNGNADYSSAPSAAQPAASYQNAGSDDFQTVVEDDGFPF